MLEPDQKYKGVIAFATLTQNKGNGNVGIALTIDCPEGEIDHIMWITGATIDNVKKTLTELGVDAKELANPETMKTIGQILLDKPCRITTEADTYKGKTGVKVKWLNGAHGRAPVPDAAYASAAAFFGGPKPVTSKGDGFDDFGVNDGDIPDGY